MINKLIFPGQSDAQSMCGNWMPFKENKCFKVFNNAGLKSFTEATKFCQDNNSTLITIHFKEEEDFITKMFENQKIPNDVWIGVKYENKKYKWNDDSDVVYQNWAPGSPKQKEDHCVQFDLSDDSLTGKWTDVLCSKGNLVVCQKPQDLSHEEMKKILITLKNNPVPIGFTYVQFPKEKDPGDLWPWMIWKDVTSDYAGVFFRAGGGDAAPFGQVQQGDSPRLVKVETSDAFEGMKVAPTGPAVGYLQSLSIPLNGATDWTDTGSNSGAGRYIKFETSGTEVRPKNMAIKVWRRIY